MQYNNKTFIDKISKQTELNQKEKKRVAIAVNKKFNSENANPREINEITSGFIKKHIIENDCRLIKKIREDSFYCNINSGKVVKNNKFYWETIAQFSFSVFAIQFALHDDIDKLDYTNREIIDAVIELTKESEFGKKIVKKFRK